MNNVFQNKLFVSVLLAVLAISGFATVYSQSLPERSRLIQLAGYGSLLVVWFLKDTRLPSAAWWLAAAPAAQAIGYFKTGNPLDAIVPIEMALRTIVVVGFLPKLIDARVNVKVIVLAFLALALVNYLASQWRYGFELLSNSRVFSNMAGGYAMLFVIAGFCVGGRLGLSLIVPGAFLLFLTSCRSAAAGVIVGCGAFTYLSGGRLDRRFLWALALLLPLAAGLAWYSLSDDAKTSLQLQIEHFLSPEVDRSERWGTGLALALESPWIGQGQDTSSSENCHNVWLAAFQAGGVGAMMLLIVAQYRTIRALIVPSLGFWSKLGLCWFLALLTRSGFEGGTGAFPAMSSNWFAVTSMFIVGLGLRFGPYGSELPQARVRRKRRPATAPAS